MAQSDARLMMAQDIAASFGLLTRLPIKLDSDAATARGAAAAWAWPIVGAFVGALAWAMGAVSLGLGLAPGFAAGLALIAATMVTGAMHEDGLADSADGLWGGWDKARRLAIMKDSHIGTYGVMALLLINLLRWQALTQLFTAPSGLTIIGVAALSRVPMVLLMARLRNARGTGLAQSVGRPTRQTAGLAAAIGAGIAIICFGWGAVPVALAMLATTLILGLIAKAKIDGQTGDILGASQQLAESVGLVIATLA